MTKARWAVLFALAVIAGYGALTWYSRPEVRWTIPQIEALIAKEVPAGAERSEVEAFFDRHDIDHVFIDHAPEDSISDGKLVFEQVGLTKEQVSGCVRGYIHEAEKGLLYAVRIYIYFFFDQHGRTITSVVRSHNIGL